MLSKTLKKDAKSIFPNISNSDIKFIIKNGLIEFNNQDEIHFNKRELLTERLLTNFSYTDHLEEYNKNKNRINILFENSNLIVAIKLTGWVTHSDRNHDLGYTDLLQIKNIIEAKDPFLEIKPINRLDKETEGILLFSKNTETHSYYSKLFKTKNDITKEYVALCNCTEDTKAGLQFVIDKKISEKPLDRKYQISETGKEATTQVLIEKITKIADKNIALIRATLITGRTHQIRVHLESVGLPIIGDSIYNDIVTTSKMYLCSTKLSIPIDNKIETFTYIPKWYKEY